MPIDGHPPTWQQRFLALVCPPCRAGYHQDCRGGVVTCECWTELLIEAEETP